MKSFLVIVCVGVVSSFVHMPASTFWSRSERLRVANAVKVDFYQVLGIQPSASDAEIKRAYRRAATKYHPDMNKEAGASERFSEVCQAYETLKDPKARTNHDRQRGGSQRSQQAWGRTSSTATSSSSSNAYSSKSQPSTSSSPSSRSRQRSKEEESYENPEDLGDSFGAIFGDLLGAVAKTGVGAVAGAAVGGATGGVGGAVRGGFGGAAQVGGGVGSVFEDLVSFLEARVDGFGSETSEVGEEFEDLLRASPVEEIAAEVEAGRTLLAALTKKASEARQKCKAAEAELQEMRRAAQSKQRQAGRGGRLGLSDLELEANIAGNVKGCQARCQELETYTGRAKQRQRRLEERLAELRQNTNSRRRNSQDGEVGAGRESGGGGGAVPPHRQARDQRRSEGSRRQVEDELQRLKREMGM